MTKTRFRFILLAILAIFIFSAEGFMIPSSASARPSDEEETYDDQDSDTDTEEEGNDADADDEEEEGEEEFDPDTPIPDPERVSGARLQTKDSILLSATYFPGNRGKKSVPVILLHDWQGKRADVEVLAKELQAQGCAVLIPDLRGHGKSNRRLIGQENTETFSAMERITPGDLREIVEFDLPCLKKFFMQQNNSGRVNIDKLCVGGVGFGGLAAAFFANSDWNPMVKRKKANPGLGDVKGFFIVSPPRNLKGIRFIDALSNPNWAASVSCIVISGSGKDKKFLKPMEAQVKKFCGREAMERCWFRTYESKDEGADLIQDAQSDAVLDILAFVDLRCAKRDLLWKNRR